MGGGGRGCAQCGEFSLLAVFITRAVSALFSLLLFIVYLTLYLLYCFDSGGHSGRKDQRQLQEMKVAQRGEFHYYYFV